MPAGLKSAARYYVLRFWASVVDMSGVAPVTRTAEERQAATDGFIRPPDQFDQDVDDHHDYRGMHSGM